MFLYVTVLYSEKLSRIHCQDDFIQSYFRDRDVSTVVRGVNLSQCPGLARDNAATSTSRGDKKRLRA